MVLLDVSPLFRYRDYRRLFIGQLFSIFGTMLTYVALPYQIYHLTHSSLAVGMIGVAQLGPLLVTALVGGAFADAVDRRKLLIIAESVLALCSLTLTLNALSSHPQLWLIYVVAALASAVNGFHRPAHNSMIPRLIDRKDIPAVSALNSFKGTLAAVAGPATGGVLIAAFGLPITYALDVLTFAVSLVTLFRMKKMPASGQSQAPSLASIAEGVKYAGSRQELMGTYIVDIVAMIFGMPMALFPAIADGFGGARVLGWLYAAPEVGALLATVFSAWTKKVTRHGAAVMIAAGVWGLAIIAFGFSKNIVLALVFLVLAGAADMVSAIFRNTIWNLTIPDHLRGRLAGLEMISYMSGPALGNAESGLAAALVNTQFSVVSGGVLCVVGVLACVLWLPGFWRYDYKPI